MVKLSISPIAFLKWVDENRSKISEEDLNTLNKAVSIIANTSAFEWCWLWPKLRSILAKALTDPDVVILDEEME